LVTETRVAAAVVAMKTMAATAMAGAQTRTINNQLKAAVAMVTKNDDGDSDYNDYTNDGDGGGGGGGGGRGGGGGGGSGGGSDGGRWWRWAL
jgi:hypothetical protein